MPFKQLIALIGYKAYADLRTEIARTYLGILWWLFEPMMYMAVFYLVFAVLLNRGTEDFVAFLIIGLICWTWFHATVMRASNSIVMHTHLMQQVYLPKIMFPLAVILANSLKFLIVYGLLLLFVVLYGKPPSIYWLGIIPTLLIELLFISGVSLLVAAIIPFIPDLSIVVDNLLHGMLFLSGVFYVIRDLPHPFSDWMMLNPMAVLLDAQRAVLLYGQWPDWTHLFLSALVALFLIFIAALLFKRYDYSYPRIA
ncbi:MAG: ABC transporter permease [gamma proteobacterium symbiont of Bathyaustriella thionipta]|nr:ABC transporter permease [gamma proteobacterium symbiont of Bathyaustriella thionipta]